MLETKRERAVLALALAAIAALAWWYLWKMAGAKDGMNMNGMAMENPAGGMTASAWSPREFLALFLMWTVMMAAMMLPSAAPMILVYQSFQRRRQAGPRGLQSTWLFVAGYLAAWAGYPCWRPWRKWPCAMPESCRRTWR